MIKKIITVALAVCLLFCFVACGNKPSGIYYSGDMNSGTYTKYDFDGGNLTIESYINGVKDESSSLSGKYEIKDNMLTIYHEDSDGVERAVSMSFEMLDEESNDSIKIDAFVCKRAS